MNIKIRTSFFDIQKFFLAVEEKALIMRNADNQIILPMEALTVVQMSTLPDGTVSVDFITPDRSVSGCLEDAATADALAKALQGYAVDCRYPANLP